MEEKKFEKPAEQTPQEEAENSTYFLRLLGNQKVKSWSPKFLAWVNGVRTKAKGQVLDAFQLVLGWKADKLTFKHLGEVEALKVTLRSFLPASSALKREPVFTLKDLGSEERDMARGHCRFEGQAKWRGSEGFEAGAHEEPREAREGPTEFVNPRRSGKEVWHEEGGAA